MIREEFTHWFENYIINTARCKIFVVWIAEPGGIGDAITTLPAFRHLKNTNEDKDIVLITYPTYFDIFKRCKYIDCLIDITTIKNLSSIRRSPIDRVIMSDNIFENLHKNHVLKSLVKFICEEDWTEDISLDYEIELFDYDLPVIEKAQQKLTKKCKGKKMVAIAPAYTMYSRIWQSSYWKNLVNLLQEDGFFVVSIGHADDLEVKNVDFDARGKYAIHHIPKILDVFDTIFLLNSGMAHIAALNPDIKTVYLCVGQFLPKDLAPYRRGKMGHNTIFVHHSCPIREQCFNNHVSNESIFKQRDDFLTEWHYQNQSPFPESEKQLLLKYICWNYCDKETDKYECSKMITPQHVFDSFKRGEYG